MAEDGFPLPGSSYKELCKIIAGYSETNGPSSPSEVAKLTGIHDTQVSRSNKFLVATGIVQGGQKKASTELGHKLGRALHFEQDDVIRQGWKEVFSNTDFFQKIVSSVRIRKGMEESALLSHIAFTSGSAKSGNAMAGAGAIVEILRIVGAIEGKGGTVVATDVTVEPDAQTGSSLAIVQKSDDDDADDRLMLPNYEDEFKPRFNNGASLQINLNIACTPDQLEGLGVKLRLLRQEFESSEGLDLNVNLPEQTATDSKE